MLIISEIYSYFQLKYKSKLSNFLKLRIRISLTNSPSYLRQLERPLKWLGAASRGCDGTEEIDIIQEMKNVFDLFDGMQLIKQCHLDRAGSISVTNLRDAVSN